MSKLSDRVWIWRKATRFPSTVSSTRHAMWARWATLAGTAPGPQPLFDRLAPPGVGVADPDVRRGDGSFGEVLVHCGGPNTCHVRGCVHVNEIERAGLEWGLWDIFHGAQCVASAATQRGRWALFRSLAVAVGDLAHTAHLLRQADQGDFASEAEIDRAWQKFVGLRLICRVVLPSLPSGSLTGGQEVAGSNPGSPTT